MNKFLMMVFAVCSLLHAAGALAAIWVSKVAVSPEGRAWMAGQVPRQVCAAAIYAALMVAAA